jgi:glycosyltransferase involved in cell wall biosynthesis
MQHRRNHAQQTASHLVLMLEGITIVLPCHDEAPNVEAAVTEALAAGRAAASAVQVVVVDDGSRDATGAIAQRLAAEHPEVQIVTHAACRGYGAALRGGIAAATQPWILLTDGDLQFDVMQLPDFARDADEVDLLHGYRLRRRDPWHRRVTARAWNLLVRSTFAIPVRDVDCAFKLVRHGATFSTELVVKAQAAGARLRERGVEHRARPAGRQSGNRPDVIARAFRELRTLRQAQVPGHGTG